MSLNVFWQGLFLGVSVAAPVGPIGILCIHRSLKHGFRAGFISGLGAATADLCYGLLAALGLTFISDFLIQYQHLLQMFGLLFLLFLGFKILRSKDQKDLSIAAGSHKLLKNYLSTFVLTISNPLTILFFIAAFSGLNLVRQSEAILSFVLGVFTGSGLWWLFLSSASTHFQKWMTPSVFRRINNISGIALLLFGGYFLGQIIMEIQ